MVTVAQESYRFPAPSKLVRDLEGVSESTISKLGDWSVNGLTCVSSHFLLRKPHVQRWHLRDLQKALGRKIWNNI